MTPSILAEISNTLRTESDLEGVVRRFLTLIQLVTGLQSTYLTRIDLAHHRQTVLFSHNISAFQIPEGLSVAWGDTLCKRALDEGVADCTDVTTRWRDSDAARALGIQSYLSAPIFVGPDLYGTLCGASAEIAVISDDNRTLLRLVGEIIALYIERDGMMRKLNELNRTLEATAVTDPLTGLPNRRYMQDEIERLFAIADRQGGEVLIAFIDLDGFKLINDTLGHDTGDALLTAIARRLTATLRRGDVAGRIGGDEFLVCGLGPLEENHGASAARALAARLERALTGTLDLGTRQLAYGGPSVGAIARPSGGTTPREAIRQADAAMYAEKLRRKERLRASAPPGAAPVALSGDS